MRPENTRILRRERHKAWRGIPRGRRSTRKVQTTYGRHQKERDRLAAWGAVVASTAVLAACGGHPGAQPQPRPGIPAAAHG